MVVLLWRPYSAVARAYPEGMEATPLQEHSRCVRPDNCTMQAVTEQTQLPLVQPVSKGAALVNGDILLPRPFQSAKGPKGQVPGTNQRSRARPQNSQQCVWVMAPAGPASWLVFFQEPGSIALFLPNKN